MDNKLFKDGEKLLVKVSGTWQKAEYLKTDEEGMLLIKTREFPEVKVAQDSPYLEKLQHPAQRFSYAEAKERLQDAYISFDKLPKRVQDDIVKGKEYIHTGSYVHDNEMKEIVKAVQLIYDQYLGSRVISQTKKNEKVKLDEAKAFNHQFTKEEFNLMVKEGKFIVFQGSTNDGVVFKKLAYYEPRLNNIRTKPALSEKSYFFGTTLSKTQADALNKGETIKIVSDIPNKGKKAYEVSFDPKNDRYNTKSLDNLKEIKVNSAETVEKKKNRSHEITQ